MATYYVRKNGSDANSTAQAQNPATAWLTIDKAANNVAAGDTVYVGAGTYRELVTMDASGSSGNQISFVADVDGSQTGDAGLVVISAFTHSRSLARVACWDPDGRTFITVRGFTMQGGDEAVVYSPNSTNDNYEGVIFEDCAFLAGPAINDRGFWIDMNAATTPTGQGLTVRRCMFHGKGIAIDWDSNVSADQNLKVLIENCVFVLFSATGTPRISALTFTVDSLLTFRSGGITFNHNTVMGAYWGVVLDGHSSKTFVVTISNCVFQDQASISVGDSNCVAMYANTVLGPTAGNVGTGAGHRSNTSTWMLGGIADFPLYRFLGWSPYLPWEPMRPNSNDDWTSLIGDAASSTLSDDLYGNPRPMSQAGPPQSTYFFDASDAGPTDDEGVWTNDLNFFKGVAGWTTLATTSTPGSTTTNELRGTGTNAPDASSAISLVEWRVRGGAITAALSASVYWTTELIGNVAVPQNQWTNFTTLTVPTGGWTWAKVQALEVVAFQTGAGSVQIAAAEVRVTHSPHPRRDRGAVEGRARAEQETTVVRTGLNSMRFEGAGFHEFLLAVNQPVTVTAYGRYDTNHAGPLPQMVAKNIPGQVDQTATMTGAADTWELLTLNLLPNGNGVARVRLISRDTSISGNVYFDGFEVV